MRQAGQQTPPSLSLCLKLCMFFAPSRLVSFNANNDNKNNKVAFPYWEKVGYTVKKEILAFLDNVVGGYIPLVWMLYSRCQLIQMTLKI